MHALGLAIKGWTLYHIRPIWASITGWLSVYVKTGPRESYPEQRNVHLPETLWDGGFTGALVLEVEEKPGHSVHGDVGHHRERIPVEKTENTMLYCAL